jgi:hypothetical protein
VLISCRLVAESLIPARGSFISDKPDSLTAGLWEITCYFFYIEVWLLLNKLCSSLSFWLPQNVVIFFYFVYVGYLQANFLVIPWEIIYEEGHKNILRVSWRTTCELLLISTDQTTISIPSLRFLSTCCRVNIDIYADEACAKSPSKTI